MGLPRTEDPSWACTYAMPDGHGIFEADFPRGKEGGSHVVIPYLENLENLPNLINIGWEISVSKPKFTRDGVRVTLRHEFPKAIGSWI